MITIEDKLEQARARQALVRKHYQRALLGASQCIRTTDWIKRFEGR